jgi:hypothetical protein
VPRPRRRRAAAGLAFALAVAPAVARADSPAAIAPPDARAAAEASFARFAGKWLARVREHAEQARANPTVRPGPRAPVVTWRGAAPGYETELHPTGDPRSPWVGVLRYTENVYACEDLEATRCRVASSEPVTELFRWRDGRWSY